MALGAIQAIGFDLGNTLVEFGPRQLAAQQALLGETLAGLYGSCDLGRLAQLRAAQQQNPYRQGNREDDMPGVCREIVRTLYERDPEPDELATLLECRYRAFLAVLELPAGVGELLAELRRRYPLALVSNYPCGRAIRDGLAQLGIAACFRTVVVSGDVGWVKPDPRPFAAALAVLGVTPETLLFVGDNWLADVQGAKRLGMRAVLTTQFEPYASYPARPGDSQPDARIACLAELPALLA